MKQIAIIGLGLFGRRVLEELEGADVEILVIDKDRDVVEACKDRVKLAYVADAIDQEVIMRVIPESLDTAIVDLGNQREASILVTNYLKKIGVPRILAKAESNEHGEILQIVGATHVVFPHREAAKRIVPMLVSSAISSYLPLSPSFVIAEVTAPERYVGMTLIEANLRRERQVNVIAMRKEDGEEYSFFTPDHRIDADDVLLIAGTEEHVSQFAQLVPETRPRWSLSRVLSWLRPGAGRREVSS